MANSFKNAGNCMKLGCFCEILAFVVCCSLTNKAADISFWERYDYYSNSSSFSYMWILAIIGILLLIIGVIWWTGAAASATVDVVAELIEFTINKVVEAFSVKEEINRRCPHALKIQILAKKKTAVDVGIFTTESDMSQKASIKSGQGVSDSIQVGQIIYLNN